MKKMFRTEIKQKKNTNIILFYLLLLRRIFFLIYKLNIINYLKKILVLLYEFDGCYKQKKKSL